MKTFIIALTVIGALSAHANNPSGAANTGTRTGTTTGTNTGRTTGTNTGNMPTTSVTGAPIPRQSNSDMQLNTRVNQQLRTSISGYNPQGYTVYSQNGTVTLQGSVRTQAEADRIEQEARRVSGVSSVNNQLTTQSR